MGERNGDGEGRGFIGRVGWGVANGRKAKREEGGEEKVTLGKVRWGTCLRGRRDRDMWDSRAVVGPCMLTHNQLPLHVVSVQCIRKSAVKRVIKGGFGGKSPKSHRAGAAVRVRERECESVSKIFETTKICEC